jgi:3-hydroxyisobutyrate dehydrogenase
MLNALASRYLKRTFSYSQKAPLPKVGFVGLGNMGFFMAENLVKAGYDVMGYDVNQETLDRFEGKGGIKATSLASLGEFSDTVITMLPNASFVEQVLFGEQDGIMAGLKPSSLVIDSSTVSPLSSKSMAERVQEAGSEMVDAPVSGGVTGAEQGTLTFMVGGATASLDRARPFLEVMGANITHCGENSGSGSIVKLCNNLALAVQMASVSEALHLGEKLGMDPAVLSSVMTTSTSRCWSVDTYNPYPGVIEGIPSSRNYEGGFAVDLMLKDLNLALEAAAEVKANLPAGSLVRNEYQTMSSEAGMGRLDFSSLFKYLTEKGKQ